MNRLMFILVGIIIFSCTGQHKKEDLAAEMKTFYGKKISFTDNLIPNWNKDSLQPQELLNTPYKVVAYVDSVGCTPCSLEKMTLWQKHSQKMDELNVKLIFILRNSNIGEVNQKLEELSFKNPVFFDIAGIFEKTNQLPKNPLLKTFLLNKDNLVIFIGAPIQNEKSWNLFEETMKQLIMNKGELPGLDRKTH